MSGRGYERAASAVRRQWADEALDEGARARVAAGVARRRARGRRRALRRAVAGVVAAAAAAAVATAGLVGDDGSQASPVAERAVAALEPGRGGLRYFARVRRTQDRVLPRSTIEASIAPGGRRVRVVERDAAGRVFSKAVTVRGRTLLYMRGQRRPVELPRGAAAAPSFLDAQGLGELRRALPDSSVSGPMDVGGRRVYELSWVDRTPDSVWRQDLTVDARTFVPVRHVRTLLRTARYVVSPRPGARMTIDFVRFERVP